MVASVEGVGLRISALWDQWNLREIFVSGSSLGDLRPYVGLNDVYFELRGAGRCSR